MNLGIDVWVRAAAGIVEVDNFFEGGNAAVVHVLLVFGPPAPVKTIGVPSGIRRAPVVGLNR